MNTKIVAIVIAAVLLVGGGISAFFLLKTSPQEQTNTPQNTSSNTPNSTTVVTAGQTQVQNEPVVDVDAAYVTLFQKLLGTKLQFTQTASSEGDMGSVYALYAKDIADAKKSFPGLSTFPIKIALVDLNKDGVSEALVLEDLPGYCGSGGCPFDIYRKDKGKWVNIYSSLAGLTVGVSSVYTNGYADLFLSVTGDSGYESKVVRYSWDGKQYTAGDIVATWNGTQFTQ